MARTFTLPQEAVEQIVKEELLWHMKDCFKGMRSSNHAEDVDLQSKVYNACEVLLGYYGQPTTWEDMK